MRKLKSNELIDQFNKIRELKIVRGEYKNNTPYYRVTGTVNNRHIDQRFKEQSRAISCHRRLPRRWHTERNKDTLSNSDLRAIYKELGFEEWGSTMTKDIFIPSS